VATDQEGFFGEGGEFQETVVQINRSAKVVKGGRRFSFSALTVVGDGRGQVGVGYGKANEVPPAVEKSISEAKKSLRRINLQGDTIPHPVLGHYGAARVFMRPAGPGTGVIAGGGVRAVCQMVGIRNILTKSLGSTNPVNLVKAAMDGLEQLKDVRDVARLRGVPVEELVIQRAEAGTPEPPARAPRTGQVTRTERGARPSAKPAAKPAEAAAAPASDAPGETPEQKPVEAAAGPPPEGTDA